MVSDCLNMASLLTFHAPSLLSYSVIILSTFAPCCSRQADYPPNIFSKASDNAVTCIQPIFHFNWDNGAWKTWPHTCFTFIFDLIMQIDFERMCHQRMQHKYRKKKTHCVSLRVSTGCRISIPLFITSKDFLSLSSPKQKAFSWGICIMAFYSPAVHTHVLAGVLAVWVIS